MAGSSDHSKGINNGTSLTASGGSSSSSDQDGSVGSSVDDSVGANSTSGDGSGASVEAADSGDSSGASAEAADGAEAAAGVPDACAELCRRQGVAQRQAAADRLQAALPLLQAAPNSMALLRCPSCLPALCHLLLQARPSTAVMSCVASHWCAELAATIDEAPGKSGAGRLTVHRPGGLMSAYE